MRRRIGTALLILVAMVPLAAIAGAAASSRGLTGEISHVWSTLTSTTPERGVGNSPGRLAQLSNSRPLYWSEGLKVGEHAPLAGVGAGGFDTARTRYSTSTLAVAHAHSYAIETFADFGADRDRGQPRPPRGVGWRGETHAEPHAPRRTPARPERTGLITMLAVVVTFGVSSLIDWTWFIPGVTVPALVCAGWLAGRGPLPRRAARNAGTGRSTPKRAIAPAGPRPCSGSSAPS